ncbi:MAG TPA: DUF2281 domain-containing protein [Anaerolineae bacterium]|nr:DUF2281 domain-containing protein [Anaerolineae bacterium]
MAAQYMQDLLKAVEDLPEERVLEVLDFAEFLKWRELARERGTTEFEAWAENLAREKGFAHLTEEDVAQIVHELRSQR